MVTQTGLALTCAHVVKKIDKKENFKCIVQDEVCIGSVIKLFSEIDLGVIHVAPTNIRKDSLFSTVAELDIAPPIGIYNEVRLVGLKNSNKIEFDTIEGTLISREVEYKKYPKSKFLKISCHNEEGMSGGPIWHTHTKKIIGITRFKDIDKSIILGKTSREIVTSLQADFYGLGIPMRVIFKQILESDNEKISEIRSIFEKVKEEDGFEKISKEIVEKLSRFQLDFSPHFNEQILQQIGFTTYRDIKKFLRNSHQWEKIIESISGLENGDEWLRDAFFSIKSGSKGLFDAHYLDHALISVPPPSGLLEKIIDTLKLKHILGLEAPAGWGKSRLILWIALSFALQNKTVYYFPDPLEFNDGIYNDALKALLEEKNNVVIVDDFHLRTNTSNEVSFWRTCFYLASKNHNELVFTLTHNPESKGEKFSPFNFQIISSHEYISYWRPQWIERFETWFKALNTTILQKQFFLERIKAARETRSPWGFVSVIVNLKELIKKQLSITLNANLVVLFTILVWSFASSRERGISSKELYKGLKWIKQNSRDHWKVLETTGGKLWDHVNDNNEELFLKEITQQINNWRKSPRDLTEIRLLPSAGVEIGSSTPIRAHHVAWWYNALSEIWKEDWKDFKPLIHVCTLIILHSSPIIELWSLRFFGLNDIENCIQIEVLEAAGGRERISDISPLRSLINLRELNLDSNHNLSNINPIATLTKLQILNISNTKVSDITPLADLTILQELYMWNTNVTNLKPIETLTKLQKLVLWENQTSDISPLASLTDLWFLSLDSKNLSDISSLSSLTNLKYLLLPNTNISDISPLAPLTNLKRLFLSRTNISDISPLTSIKSLKMLRLEETDISEITPLVLLMNLESLNLNETKISVDDIRFLKERLKTCDFIQYINSEDLLLEKLESYESSVESDPDLCLTKIAFAQNSLGVLYCDLKRFQEAEIRFKDALEKYKILTKKNSELYLSDVVITQWNLGATYRNLLRYEEGERAYKKAIDIIMQHINKNDNIHVSRLANVYYNLGIFYNDFNKFNDAEKAYRNALDIYNRLVDSNFGSYLLYAAVTQNKLGILYWDMGKMEKAEEMFKTAFTTYKVLINDTHLSDILITQIYLEMTLQDLGRPEEADKYFNEILEIELEEKEVWFERGIALYRMDKYKDAIKSFNKVLEIDPNYIWAWFNKGIAFYNLKEYRLALECFDQVLEIDSEYEDAWFSKGSALIKLEKFEQAVEWYEKILEIYPYFESGWYNKAFALTRLSRFDNAIECYNKLLEFNPEDIYALAMKGYSLLNLKKYDEAEFYYDKALEQDKEYGIAWYHKACLESLKDNKDKAIEFLKKAIELNPGWKNTAKNDKDFINIREKNEFKDLISEK